MRKKKRFLAFMLATVMLMSMSGISVMAAGQEETSEDYVEISLDDAAVTLVSSYYSKALPVFNIATTGVSNEYRFTLGSVSDGATITKLEITGIKSTGSGTIYCCIKHEASGMVICKEFTSPTIFTEFNDLTNDAFIIWFVGEPWTTVRGGNIKVYYTY